MSTAVALPPITYVPKKHKNMFIDNISDFSATVFKNTVFSVRVQEKHTITNTLLNINIPKQTNTVNG